MRPRSAESVAVAVFAKAPIPGQTKTRLIPRIGAERAAALQHRLMRLTLKTAVAADVGPVTLYCAPDCHHPEFAACGRDFGVELIAQCGADLGERMHNAFRQLGTSGPVVVIGADCPALTPGHIQAAGAILRTGVGAVVQPAEDGGYVLLGLRRPERSLFDGIAWGESTVMAETRDRLRRLKWDWRELETMWDVDRPADLDRLADMPTLSWLVREVEPVWHALIRAQSPL